MKTKISIFVISTMLCTTLIFPVLLTNYEKSGVLQVGEIPSWFVIEGLVENPLNMTYADLWSFPLISEVTTLECIGSGQGGMSVTYNWTGVPLFYLLNMAKVIPGDYREIVFNATDGFSSSILLETAMEPTTILALEANGTDLRELEDAFASEYRVAIPCRWGYKWVKLIEQIIVVDYDYKGTYEKNWGLSDEAIRPNCTMPTTNPPIRTFNITDQEEHVIRVLSNSSIESFSFISNKTFAFNLTRPDEANGYLYITFLKGLLPSPYQVYLDQEPVQYSHIETSIVAYIYVRYKNSTHTIEIKGEQYHAHGDVNSDLVVNILDAIVLSRAFGSQPGGSNWNLMADINHDEVVNLLDAIIVSKNFGKTWL